MTRRHGKRRYAIAGSKGPGGLKAGLERIPVQPFLLPDSFDPKHDCRFLSIRLVHTKAATSVRVGPVNGPHLSSGRRILATAGAGPKMDEMADETYLQFADCC